MTDRSFRGATRLAAIFLACTALQSAPAAAQPAAANIPTTDSAPQVVHFGTWGVDISTRDPSVRPGDDFQRYAMGKWLDTHEIPADKSQNGVGSELNDRNQEQLRAIIMSAPKDSQLGAFYASYMDEARLEQLDDKPLRADLAKIDAIKSKAEFTRYMAHTFGDFGSTLFGVGVLPDFAHPEMNIGGVFSNGLGMPDRDYYLLDKYRKQREAYRSYIERTFRMIGDPNPSSEADKVLAFETEIAKVSWPRADLRDITKLNNPMTLSQLKAYAPKFDWSTYLREVKVMSPHMIVGDKSAVKGMTELYAKTPLETLKTWERFKVSSDASNYLSKRFVDSNFEYVKTLTGATELRPRWRRGIGEVDGRLGELLGKTYVDRYFPAQSKAMMEDLVANLKKAAAVRIQNNSWMGEATKKAALVKLSKMDVMVGYPDKFRDYSKLEMRPDDLYGNVKRSGAFDWAYQLEDLNKPVDRKKWGMSPATVDAYNGGAREQDRLSGGYPSAALLRPDCGRGRELWRDRRRSSATRSATASTTRDAKSTRMAPFATGGRRRTRQVHGADGRAGRAIYAVRGRARSARQRGADDGREYRRHGRPGDRAPGVSRVAVRQAGAGDRRPDRRPALLPRLRAGLAREAAR